MDVPPISEEEFSQIYTWVHHYRIIGRLYTSFATKEEHNKRLR